MKKVVAYLKKGKNTGSKDSIGSQSYSSSGSANSEELDLKIMDIADKFYTNVIRKSIVE